MATCVAPSVCPSRRAVPNIPLAPPLRLDGAEEMIVLLLGVWNNPKPDPQMNSRHIISTLVGLEGSTASRKSPVANITMPIPPSIPAWIRSTNRPASGAIIIVAIGQGVRSHPVVTSLCPRVPWRKKGREIMASICPVKEQMDVPIDMEKMGIRIRSTGNKGNCWRNWRRTKK